MQKDENAPVEGLFDCPELGHRVTTDECAGFQGTGMCPDSCLHNSRSDTRINEPGAFSEKSKARISEILKPKKEEAPMPQTAAATSPAPDDCKPAQKYSTVDSGPEPEKTDRLYLDPPGNKRDADLLIDPHNGKAYGRICKGCNKPLEWKYFSREKKGLCGHHAKCKTCTRESQKAGIAPTPKVKKSAPARPAAKKPAAAQGPAASKPAGQVLSVDFSGHPELYDRLVEAAEDDIRPVEMEVLFLVKKVFERRDGTAAAAG